jgi:GNAT superfamily N-acetyltransferase
MPENKGTHARYSNREEVTHSISIQKELEIAPLGAEHLEKAAVLVAERYRDERARNPLLYDKYENAATVRPLLDYNREKQAGVAAVRGGEVVGFITSLPFSNWGIPAVWMPDWGHGAVKADREYLYRRMYAALAEWWVERGHLKHVVMTFADEHDILDTWFSMGFGMTNIDTLRDVSALPGPVDDVEMRPAGPGDFDTLMKFRDSLCVHLTSTPVFQFIPSEAREKSAEEFRKQLVDGNLAVWLACENGKVTGCMRVIPSSQCDFRMPTVDKSICGISMAFTEEADRLRGVGTALLDRVLKWAREKGYTRCGVDFESANIPASRFWLTHFRQVCYTLFRDIDGRILQSQPGGVSK